MSDEEPREIDDELDLEDEQADPTWLPPVEEVPPVEASPADWIDQQRAVPPEDPDEDR